MVSHDPIPISEEMYVTSGPAMFVTRCLCLFPLAVRREGTRLYLKKSTFSKIYSWVFLVISSILIYWGYALDVLIGKDKSVRMRTESDLLATFIDVTAIILVNFFVIFVTPFKYATFSKYVKCFTEVDKIIPPTNLKSARNLSVVTMSILLIGLSCALFTDMLVYFRTSGYRTSNMFVVKCYGPFYIAYHVLYAYHFSYWHLVTCILRRVALLNTHLDAMGTSKSVNNSVSIFTTSSSLHAENEPLGYMSEIVMATRRNKNKDAGINNADAISKLMQAFGKLSDAVDHVNQLVGINTAITLVGILFHLVVAPYAVITSIARDQKDFSFTLLYLMWCCINSARLMFLVQPCYNCLLEVQKTKDLVCRLIASTNIDNQAKLQLQDFSTVLELRKFEFTASGLATIDRHTVAALIAAIVTHLVVLLQVALEEKST